MLSLFKPSPRISSSLQSCVKYLSVSSVKKKSQNDSTKVRNDLETVDYKPSSLFQSYVMNKLGYKVWNERAAIRKTKKNNKFFKRVDHILDFYEGIQNTKKFPLTLQDWLYYFKRLHFRNMVLEQKFLPERHGLLKPDLAAAHFILERGGAVKFDSQVEWMRKTQGQKIILPTIYIPGLHIEAIDAEGTDLYFGGLENLCDLEYIKWLSLKGLKEIDDWCLDYVSKEFGSTLEHLDISDCVNVTYRALSCFYRFENLKTLVVHGVPDTVELKTACVLLLEIMPDLKIEGIDLNIPEKIEAVKISELSSKT